MDLLSPKTIKELLSRYSAAPLKRMGQNFLINQVVLEKIIAAAQLDGGEAVLEIGPGLGALTEALAKRVKIVVAIEKDRKFVEILKETLKNYKNVKIIHADILRFDIKSLLVIPAKARNQKINEQIPAYAGTPSGSPRIKYGTNLIKSGMTKINYKLIANLPYNIASAVIRKFLEAENQPSEMILMVQKEVAQRICASPPNMSLLAVSVQFYSDPKIVDHVSKGSFWPQPKVDSAILQIKSKAILIPGFHPDDTDIFFKIVKAGFSSPRKQLAGNLAKGLKIERNIIDKILKNAGIEPSRRAETLSVEEWLKIAGKLI